MDKKKYFITGSSDDLQNGVQTQVWLATVNKDERLTGEFFFHHKKEKMNPLTYDKNLVNELIQYLEDICRKCLVR